MNKDFCESCTSNELTPPCIITKIPSNPDIEDILLRKDFVLVENLICHTYAQIYENNCLKINENCDECGLCLAMCKHLTVAQSLDFSKLEKAIFEDLSKICILLKRFCPSKIIATEVKTKGNSRTKRIDLCISFDKKIYLIKLLKNLDKIPMYSRSFDDVIKIYSDKYKDFSFSKLFLVPESIALKNKNPDLQLITLKDLLKNFGETNGPIIK